MEVKILAFGIAKEIIGAPSLTFDLQENATVGELKNILEEKYHPLAKLSSFLLAVNDEYSEATDAIHPGDEIAIVPPVSGG